MHRHNTMTGTQLTAVPMHAFLQQKCSFFILPEPVRIQCACVQLYRSCGGAELEEDDLVEIGMKKLQVITRLFALHSKSSNSR